MAVQRQAGFHAQGVAGAQAGGLRAQFNQAVPQPDDVFALHEHFEAQRLAGVAGAGDAGGAAFQLHDVQAVLDRLDGQRFAAGELGQDVLGFGSLDGDAGPLGGDVGEFAVITRQQRSQVSQVLVDVRGVDDQPEVVFFKAIQVGVIHRGAVRGLDDAVLAPVQFQSTDVAGDHVLQEGKTVFSFDQDAAHVGHIKDAAGMAGVQMLGYDAFRVLDRHLPAAEIHHGGAGSDMHVVQLSSLEFAHSILLCLGDGIKSRRRHHPSERGTTPPL